MNEQDLEQAQEAIRSILDVLSVACVVFVDDVNGKSVSVEDVIIAAQGLDADSLLEAFPELGSQIPKDLDMLARKIRQEWEQLALAVQLERAQAVMGVAQHDDNETDDIAKVSTLKQLIPENKLTLLSPAEWEEQEEKLLQDKRTLFLFDLDLKADGSGKEGIKIIASLLAKDNSEGLTCGLLSHKVIPGTELQTRDELCEEHGIISRDRFLVISKQYLNQDLNYFARELKFAALSPGFAKLKDKAKEIMADATQAAEKEVEKVNIYDLDHIVFKVSANEGLWEPDMLFRLHAMFHRLESRRLAHEGGKLEVIAGTMRAVSEIPIKCNLPTPSRAWELQRKELYEYGGYINKNHLPLELGDIFEKDGGTSSKKYILLAQPCDLMVRNDGKRYPEPHRLPLAEIVLVSEDRRPEYSEEMQYFDTAPGKKWYVKFKLVHFVRGCLLDLCVFNQDGVAKLTVDGNAPSGIRPAWKARHDTLSRHWGRAVRNADMLVPAADESEAVKQYREKLKKNLGDRLFDDEPFKGKLTDTNGLRSLTFNCKRVCRLSRARAIGLLMSYTATLARPAHDRLFGDPPESAD